jgi:acyl-CoA thioesterase YciA
VTLKISVEAERLDGELVFVTEVIATFVAIDMDGKSRNLAEVG